MMYVKADDESILSYGEEVQRWQAAFMPLDLSAVVLGVGIIIASREFVCNRLGTNSGSMGTIRCYSKGHL